MLGAPGMLFSWFLGIDFQALTADARRGFIRGPQHATTQGLKRYQFYGPVFLIQLSAMVSYTSNIPQQDVGTYVGSRCEGSLPHFPLTVVRAP